VCSDYLSKPHLLKGIQGKERFIPIAKGGARNYFKPDLWYVDWSTKAVAAYHSNSKARFQNSECYFRTGISVPMVSSTRITAAILTDRVFDQSIVGVFPNETRWLFYLLAFFNSSTCTTLVRTINPSANNSANYIKKIPFIYPESKALRSIGKLTEGLVNSTMQIGEVDQATHEEISQRIEEVYGF